MGRAGRAAGSSRANKNIGLAAIAVKHLIALDYLGT
jgi:hypothetical protein